MTSTPQAAATDTMLSATALSGRSSERKARASSTKVISVMIAIISGNEP